ncbi:MULTISPECIES: hypothetical protein [unclassified Mycobacterium]|uniref:hypothetical protein n=1 Tax=unclassified Mycobacterium TaxID=2642494 RepID=UPI0008008608|nr:MULTISPECIES: hypothetical protein [unclassified Mycobacterium]OBG62154.1 hypothetical protein A5703_21920 [Mycobacterium sp. E188]OBG63874.1 hypothetical protein A5704_14775 [Mycobacterium sp. E735]OBG73009.1 hypothetical protein A5701_24770 [Mycobacterium sp. E3305]OBG83420.1 hypothetical protein A9X05_18405 [Mycobacterium sp. E3298]OBH32535.1 hypothetical protein A9X03_00470 [Mycobacterium sp. E1715]
MTDVFPSDEAPEGDAAEQLQPVDVDDESGLDTEYLTVADREANEADVIEQAYIVPTEDEWEDGR